MHDAPRAGDGKHAPEPSTVSSISAPLPVDDALPVDAISPSARVVSRVPLMPVTTGLPAGADDLLARFGRALAATARDTVRASASASAPAGSACLLAVRLVCACVGAEAFRGAGTASLCSAARRRGASVALVPLTGRLRAAHSRLRSSLLRSVASRSAEWSHLRRSVCAAGEAERNAHDRRACADDRTTGPSSAAACATRKVMTIRLMLEPAVVFPPMARGLEGGAPV